MRYSRGIITYIKGWQQVRKRKIFSWHEVVGCVCHYQPYKSLQALSIKSKNIKIKLKKVGDYLDLRNISMGEAQVRKKKLAQLEVCHHGRFESQEEKA